MNLKQQAMWSVAKEIGAAALVGALVAVMIHFIGITWSVIIILAAVFIYLVQLQYQIKLKRLEWERERIQTTLKD